MATQFLELRPTIWVDDVKATIDWYVQVLGFTEGNFVAEWNWGIVVKDKIEIMLSKPNAHIPYNGPQFTGSFYFTVDNVDSIWERLKDLPNVYYPLETFDYGMREFAIKDCNGYILQFGQNVVAS